MESKGRALFNTLQFSYREDPSLQFEEWAITDYRLWREAELFRGLSDLGIVLKQESLLAYIEDLDSPEDLIEALWVGEEETEDVDRAYLLLFELWRRLTPHKQSLSIFCDELDHLIDGFDRCELEDEEPLQKALAELEGLLEESVDNGEDPREVFSEVSNYCALDLESFIYDYAAEEIDRGHSLSASEIVNGFFPYFSNPKWLTFLQFRLLHEADPDEAEIMFDRLLGEIVEQPDLGLYLEMAHFLVREGGAGQFIRVIKAARSGIEEEEDFQEILTLTKEFYQLLDRDVEAEEVATILAQREGRAPETEISEADQGLQAFYAALEDFNWTEA